ncbi:H-type small acid-soluble spore protein [Parageobacillus thermoglucosidasius]|uniref:Small, acid-soluble spore protein, H family n=3 Tax=Anoxybacillaceae TaxID=3120669 RepID=A0AAN0YLV8_PARTM|nr:H-type small acid-soluble spore protein [Parageobacillus thermoglucosidasius]AEH46654.1 small acid-soluble spore protein, H-type [Parageobacillus thermoglucosidasius C56-YS93]ALF08562.1 spore protein [Parageobacillus thermoglucosidasius]ALF11947.1 spore protein [Parageobacillus thermoglucosidasius]ANZ28645.1 small, acid-soluble spore protein, H family [Parageobacillus thermoglucosidasius]ANZ32031.1 small, acid-soluble spore protein, H family [Parageobacillus thermoglucosidasius]
MDINRVKQIVSSPADIPVYYNGVSVWIDDYNEQEETATIHLRDGHLREQREVPVEELTEKQ